MSVEVAKPNRAKVPFLRIKCTEESFRELLDLANKSGLQPGHFLSTALLMGARYLAKRVAGESVRNRQEIEHRRSQGDTDGQKLTE